MNEIGSGNWLRSNSKMTVDNCLTLDVNSMKRSGLLKKRVVWTESWSDSGTGRKIAEIQIQNLRTGQYRSQTLKLNYRWNRSVDVCDYISLVTTRPHFGGLRWWFLCPLKVDGATCRNRVAKLHLRNGHFGCRSCHDLTYLSCQQSHQLDRLLIRAGFDEVGRDALMDRFAGTNKLKSLRD
jgi:hypothetical protein